MQIANPDLGLQVIIATVVEVAKSGFALGEQLDSILRHMPEISVSAG